MPISRLHVASAAEAAAGTSSDHVMTPANVADAIAAQVPGSLPTTVGAVGTYALLGLHDSTQTIDPGDIIAGSALKYMGNQLGRRLQKSGWDGQPHQPRRIMEGDVQRPVSLLRSGHLHEDRMMDIKNPTYNPDGKTVNCKINHLTLGWIPFTASADDETPFAREVWAALSGREIAQPAAIAREVQRDAALRQIDAAHAAYLRDLTGGATVEERDTWKAKEEVARAYVAGAATSGQAAMLAAEAAGAGLSEADLAAKVIAKADSFLALIGIAAGLRAKACAAIMIAGAEDVPPEDVGARIAAALSQMNEEAGAASAQFTIQTQLPPNKEA